MRCPFCCGERGRDRVGGGIHLNAWEGPTVHLEPLLRGLDGGGVEAATCLNALIRPTCGQYKYEIGPPLAYARSPDSPQVPNRTFPSIICAL